VTTPRRVLVLGGARSGKSAFAESLLSPDAAVEYVATATSRPDDPDWTERIASHRKRRPVRWTTRETQDLPSVYADSAAPPALVDSITAWLTAILDRNGAWQDSPEWRAHTARDVEHMAESWAASDRHVVTVSDEVGSGIVPESASGRLFRDELGSLNQRLAAAADEVWLVTAGIPLRLR
jgi:adenosyl cobinamide kinase/adenosyl cobinamide phosphate guanylyltransferase